MSRHTRRFALLGIVALAGTGVLAPHAAVAAPPGVTKVSGGGATGEQSASVSKAILKGNGAASGTFTVSVPGLTRTLTVDQILRPRPTSDGYYCLSGTDSTGNVILYIKDIGNGTTTFDGWGFSLSSGGGLNCDNASPTPIIPLTLDSGDFQITTSP